MKIIKKFRCVCPAVFMMGIFICILPYTLNAADAPLMGKNELKELLDNPDVIILDVRTQVDWEQSEYKIKGAKRLEDVDAVDGLVTNPKDKTVVLYCA
jgi:predicted sulfurtransferase